MRTFNELLDDLEYRARWEKDEVESSKTTLRYLYKQNIDNLEFQRMIHTNITSELTQARITSEYWKEEHNAANIRIKELEITISRYNEFVKALLDFISRAPVRSGVCCCGEDMIRHASGLAAGHEAVDMWDYSVDGFIEEYNAKFKED